VATGTNVGRRFRGFVQFQGRSSVEDLRLLPMDPRQVLIRVEASAPCYTSTASILGLQPAFAAQSSQAIVPNHTAVGVVEEVGTLVKRVKQGDRVIVGVTSQCGQCLQCLQGSPDMCQFTFGGDVFPPFAQLSDGTPVRAELGISGFSELMVSFEEYCCPVFTDVPPTELSLLGDQLASGAAAGMCRMRIEPGSDVVVFGAGPVGIGAVQAARIMSAGRIIVVEPIRYRREIATALGATTTLDPNAEGDGLVERLRELTATHTDQRFSGGASPRAGFAAGGRGADFTICTVGRDNSPPAVERGPDPTGLLPMQQAWNCTRVGGHVMFMGIVLGNLTLPAIGVALTGRTIHPGQQGGINMMRDLPRFVRLMERGQLDARRMIQGSYSINQIVEACRAIADRTQLANVVRFA
jgi:S-(hydroxymethyl)glutathione dehydrogenase/alcohol dehydrogenase